MHAVFMPCGRVNWVEAFLGDIKAQKAFYKYTSPDGKETKQMMAQIGLRLLPFGFYDVSFPKEYKGLVLSALEFGGSNIRRYKIPEWALKQIRKVLGLEAAEGFINGEAFPWVKGMDLNHKDVAVIPIGIRDDEEITESVGKMKGWTHEAI